MAISDLVVLLDQFIHCAADFAVFNLDFVCVGELRKAILASNSAIVGIVNSSKGTRTFNPCILLRSEIANIAAPYE